MKKQVYIAQLVQEDQPIDPREEGDNLGHMVCSHRGYNLGDEQSTAPYSLGGYESREDNFLLWVFSEFIEGSTTTTIPEILLPWFTTGDGVFAKYDSHDQEVWLEETLPPTIKAGIEEWMKRNLCILPLFLYDHSGITMSTAAFSCGWDSGQVGYIYLTKEKWDQGFDRDFVQEEAAKYLTGEVETYDQYLTGEVYGKLLHRVDDEDFEVSRDIKLLESTGLYDLYMADYEFSIDEYDDAEELDACWGYYGREYAEQCCKEEFPGMCLSDALGDYCENYLIKQVVQLHNGVVTCDVTKVFTLPRENTLKVIAQIPSSILHTFTVEPVAQPSVAAPKAYRYM